MSEENIEDQPDLSKDVQSDKTNIQKDDENNQDDPKDTLIAKLKAEAKRYRQDKAVEKAKVEELEADKLKEQGKWKEMYEAEKTKTGKYENAVTRGARTSSVKTSLLKEGCDPKYVELLMKEAALDKIELDEQYQTNDDQVNFEVTRLKNAYIDFFKKDVPAPRDGNPSGDLPGNASYGDDLKTAKTQKELEAVMKKHGRM